MPRKQKQPISQDIKEEIARAIEQIPHMVHPASPPKSLGPRVPLSNNTGDDAKRRLLWLCVICIAGIILVMWVWNFRMLWYATDFSSTKKEWGINAIKDDVSTLLTEQQELLQPAVTTTASQVPETITTNNKTLDALRVAASALSQTTSSTTSTPTTNTSTISTTTTIKE